MSMSIRVLNIMLSLIRLRVHGAWIVDPIFSVSRSIFFCLQSKLQGEFSSEFRTNGICRESHFTGDWRG